MIPDMADNLPRRASPDTPAQDDPSAPSRARKSRLEKWRDRYSLVSDVLTPQRIGLVLAAIILAVSGAFGGLDTVEAEKIQDVPAAQTGQDLAVKPFTITVTKLIHFDELGSIAPAKAGTTYYMAVMNITNTSDSVIAASVLTPAIKLDAPNIVRSTNLLLYRAKDSLPARAYQPDVPVLTAAIWTADANAPRPTEATLTLSKLTWYEYFISSEAAWRVDGPAYTVTLPVQEGKKS